MRILDRYIARQVVGGTLLALAVLVALFMFLAFVDDLGSVGRGTYTLTGAVEHMLLTMPRHAFSLFPLAAVIGSLMGVGALAAASELNVVRASGVSAARIAGAAMKGAGVLVLAAVLIGELLVPYCERIAQERRSVALSNELTVHTDYGFWIRRKRSFINIRRVLASDHMSDLEIYEFDGAGRLWAVTHAASARYKDGEWLLEDVQQSTFDEDSVTGRRIDKITWKSSFQPALVDVVTVRPESLSAVGLYRYLGYLRDNGLSTGRFELALWTKIIYPVATGVMIFLAIPLVLGQLRGVGVGQRIVVGALLGIAFHVINRASGHMGIVYGLSPLGSAIAPTLGFLLLGIWLMRQVR